MSPWAEVLRTIRPKILLAPRTEILRAALSPLIVRPLPIGPAQLPALVEQLPADRVRHVKPLQHAAVAR
ncbi:MAG: hypothetical protein WA661_13320, partial [Xanthobacteraceae bacterium]